MFITESECVLHIAGNECVLHRVSVYYIVLVCVT